jgi:hypothetical protein
VSAALGGKLGGTRVFLARVVPPLGIPSTGKGSPFFSPARSEKEPLVARERLRRLDPHCLGWRRGSRAAAAQGRQALPAREREPRETTMEQASASAFTSSAAVDETPEELPTELAVGHDGTLYVALDPSKSLPGREVFEGWQMSHAEAIAAAGHLPLVELTGFVLASDGKIYGSAERVPAERREGRAIFRGYAMTAEEREIGLDELHRTAFNLTVAIQHELEQRRIAAQKKPQKKANKPAASKKRSRQAPATARRRSRTRAQAPRMTG